MPCEDCGQPDFYEPCKHILKRALAEARKDTARLREAGRLLSVWARTYDAFPENQPWQLAELKGRAKEFDAAMAEGDD